MTRININGDYLVIVPKVDGDGYWHMLTERSFLIDNIHNFLEVHPDIDVHQVTIYELRELNESRNEQARG